MPQAIAVASGAADVQALSGATTLFGYSVRESAATAAVATVLLRNGTTATGPTVAIIELAADSSSTAALPAVDCPNGVFVDPSGRVDRACHLCELGGHQMPAPTVFDEDTFAWAHGAAIADVAGTADTTYSANEVTLINDLRSALNSALAALRSAGIIAQD